MSGTLGVVAVCVTHPLWPFKVPLRRTRLLIFSLVLLKSQPMYFCERCVSLLFVPVVSCTLVVNIWLSYVILFVMFVHVHGIGYLVHVLLPPLY